MASSQASNYRILAGALALNSFTINDLARFSRSLPGTVRTTLNRHRQYIEALAAQPNGKRGGQPLQYRVIPEKHSELEDWLRNSLPELEMLTRASGSEDKTIKAQLVSYLPAFDVPAPATIGDFDREAGGGAFSTTLASLVSDKQNDIEGETASQLSPLAPSGMLVAEEQLGEMFEGAQTLERKREIVEQASDSLRAGKAEYDSWPWPKRQSELGLSVARGLRELHHRYVTRAIQVDPRTVEFVEGPQEYAKSLDRGLESGEISVLGMPKPPRFFGGSLPANHNRILIETEIDSDIAFPNGEIEIAVTGNVRANIAARSVIVRGRIEGDLVASEEVSLLEGCKLLGNITASRISIENGAFFKGGIDVQKTTQPSARLYPSLDEAIEAGKDAFSEHESVETSAPAAPERLRLASY